MDRKICNSNLNKSLHKDSDMSSLNESYSPNPAEKNNIFDRKSSPNKIQEFYKKHKQKILDLKKDLKLSQEELEITRADNNKLQQRIKVLRKQRNQSVGEIQILHKELASKEEEIKNIQIKTPKVANSKEKKFNYSSKITTRYSYQPPNLGEINEACECNEKESFYIKMLDESKKKLVDEIDKNRILSKQSNFLKNENMKLENTIKNCESEISKLEKDLLQKSSKYEGTIRNQNEIIKSLDQKINELKINADKSSDIENSMVDLTGNLSDELFSLRQSEDKDLDTSKYYGENTVSLVGFNEITKARRSNVGLQSKCEKLEKELEESKKDTRELNEIIKCCFFEFEKLSKRFGYNILDEEIFSEKDKIGQELNMNRNIIKKDDITIQCSYANKIKGKSYGNIRINKNFLHVSPRNSKKIDFDNDFKRKRVASWGIDYLNLPSS